MTYCMRTCNRGDGKGEHEDFGSVCWNCVDVKPVLAFDRRRRPAIYGRDRLVCSSCWHISCVGWMIARRSFDSGAAGSDPQHIIALLCLFVERFSLVRSPPIAYKQIRYFVGE